MSFEKNLEKIIDSMPSLPITVAKIMQITKDPTSTPGDLNQVITLDPVLTGKVLKLVNSAYYNLESQVTSIVKAIIMLGLNTIKNLSISTAILGSVRKEENFVALNMDGYWRHSLAVGVTAKLIAGKMRINPKLRDEYFIAGLLHDIGKIIMNQHFSELYLQVISEADIQRIPFWKTEAFSISVSIIPSMENRSASLIRSIFQTSSGRESQLRFPEKPNALSTQKALAAATANTIFLFSWLASSGE